MSTTETKLETPIDHSAQGVVVHRLVGPPEDDDPDLCEECGGTDYVCAAMSNGRMSPPELCPLCWPNKHHTPRLQQTLTRAALEAVRALCLEALRDYRAYRKIHPEAFQVSACSERKGAARLARRISRLFKRPNVKADSTANQ